MALLKTQNFNWVIRERVLPLLDTTGLVSTVLTLPHRDQVWRHRAQARVLLRPLCQPFLHPSVTVPSWLQAGGKES